MVDDSQNTKAQFYFILAIIVAFIPWGLQMLGITSIILGWFILIIAFLLGVYAFYIWPPSKKLHYLLRIIIVVLVGIIFFGSIFYYKNEPKKQIMVPPIPPSLGGENIPLAEPAITPPSPSIKRVQKGEPTKEDKPYFSIYSPGLIIKTNPKSQIEMNINNTGKHPAINLHHIFIIINNQFQGKPLIGEASSANEFPPNIPHTVFADFPLPEDVAPLYVVFAIRYQEQEVPSKRTSQIWHYQTWYFKTNDEWTTKGTQPPLFLNATLKEKEDIFNHLKPWLKDYRK
jgi:hypothetical protein